MLSPNIGVTVMVNSWSSLTSFVSVCRILMAASTQCLVIVPLVRSMATAGVVAVVTVVEALTVLVPDDVELIWTVH